ncbi:MAG TPA: universal stress protein [Gaiellaceae bacterium]|nr:universal stress protein [Gaiellaceae bacterium]
MGGTIVCGVGETEGRAAAELAAAVGARLGLRLVLVSVVEGAPGEAGDRLLELAREIGDGAETRIAHGPRAEALARIAAEEGADLIVVGSRAAGLGERKLRSTLARELEAATPVPVLVAPPSTRKRSERRLAVAAAALER